MVHQENHMNHRNKEYICQYTSMKNIGRELNRIEIIYQTLLRVYPAVKRRIRRLHNKISRNSAGRLNLEGLKHEYQPEDDSGVRLEVGDTVKVLPYSQIKSTLNDKGYFKGLSFQEPMEKYCNNTYKVFKIPEYVLDQGGRRINRCKDVVILEGLYCNGKGMLLEEGCDMCCLHYWKTDWLEKID